MTTEHLLGMIFWAAIATTGGPVQNTNRPSTAAGGGVVPSLTPGCRTPRSEEKLFHSGSSGAAQQET